MFLFLCCFTSLKLVGKQLSGDSLTETQWLDLESIKRMGVSCIKNRSKEYHQDWFVKQKSQEGAAGAMCVLFLQDDNGASKNKHLG